MSLGRNGLNVILLKKRRNKNMNIERFRIYFEEFFNCKVLKERIYREDKQLICYFELEGGIKITVKEDY